MVRSAVGKIQHIEEAVMLTAAPTLQTDQVRHLSENLMSQLTRGREWATPGVEAALHRMVAGLDTGIESASPRIQTSLRRLAEELTDRVETMTPFVYVAPKRVAQNAVPSAAAPALAKSRRTASGKAWLIAGAVAVAVTAGFAVWLDSRPTVEEPVPSVDVPRFQRREPRRRRCARKGPNLRQSRLQAGHSGRRDPLRYTVPPAGKPEARSHPVNVSAAVRAQRGAG